MVETNKSDASLTPEWISVEASNLLLGSPKHSSHCSATISRLEKKVSKTTLNIIT